RVWQAIPYLVSAEQRNAPIAAHGELLSVRAHTHLGVVDLAVARIEHIAVFIGEALALSLHISDERNAKHRSILAIIGAFRADVRVWVGKSLGDHTFERAIVMIDDEEPHRRFAVFGLLPQACG